MISSIGADSPVSAALEADLREWVRRHGIAPWLDADGHYSRFVEGLIAAREAGELPYDVRTFRGSHLELLVSLDGLAAGADKAQLVLHLPGFTVDTIKHTPLYELYAAGKLYRKALGTIVTEAAAGRVLPDRITGFTRQSGLTLEAADAWLASFLRDDGRGIAAELRTMNAAEVLDDLLRSTSRLATFIGHPDDEKVLWERLAAWIGLPVSWRAATLPASAAGAGDVAFAVASWALCVEYVDDVKRTPVNEHLTGIRDLPRPIIETCKDIASRLRQRDEELYRRTADETEALIADEVDAAKATDLGRVDTFRFEEDKILDAALASLHEGAWDAATGWATRRMNPKSASDSFWLKSDPSRQAEWDLVHHAARLGQAIANAGPRLGAHGGLEAAVDAYVARGAAVDRAHRHLEQRRAALLYPQLPAFETLRALLDDMRRAWRGWADAWARDFNALCRSHGFLPPSSHQQRTIFDDVVRPLTQEAGATAYFVIDAFRFEMGEELHRELAGTPATTMHLKARLAELPTVTPVGMNALAPVAPGGRLTPVMAQDGGGIIGFSSREFRVCDPETRRRAMHDRVGGASCPWLTLDEVAARNRVSLRRAIAQARLVVVHSQEIDTAGEKNVGPVVFVRVMQKLRAAWHLLREAGIRRFVFTSDHGFLLLDETGVAAQPHGRRIDPSRRHVLSAAAADHAGEARVALADLAYEGATAHVMMPETTAVFDTGRRPAAFAHGGNSLQERVIPVLTIVHRAAAGGNTVGYCIAADARPDVAGMHALDIRVDVADQEALDFGTPREIELALSVPDLDGVQVELCQAHGSARIHGGAVLAAVGERFTLFFRLFGSTDARVRVELRHAGAEAADRPFVTDARFAVTAARVPATAPQKNTPVAPAAGSDWLAQLPEGGVRQVFAHLARHGTVTEVEAAAMLGGARGLRRFALQFEALAQRAPFGIRIDVVAGVKRYVREGRYE